MYTSLSLQEGFEVALRMSPQSYQKNCKRMLVETQEGSADISPRGESGGIPASPAHFPPGLLGVRQEGRGVASGGARESKESGYWHREVENNHNTVPQPHSHRDQSEHFIGTPPFLLRKWPSISRSRNYISFWSVASCLVESTLQSGTLSYFCQGIPFSLVTVFSPW